ncbi:MAG TPA: TetR/AcrR family transcriptional regulator [Pseudolysinimonas sp.]|nr:TetR/AcrR family transcriptional regulator [Pseudolysinimonas sp.]
MSRAVRSDVVRNREAILLSAHGAFDEHGVDASLEDIASAAGIGSATLYRHFPTRHALVAAVYRDEIVSLCDHAAELADTEHPERALQLWMHRVLDAFAGSPGVSAALKSAIESYPEFSDIQSAIREAAERLVGRAQGLGRLRADAGAPEVLRMLGGLCLFDDQPGAQPLAHRVIDVFCDGLSLPAGAA